MHDKARIVFFLFSFIFSDTVHAQIGFFVNIGFRNAKAIESRLERKLAKGKLSTDNLVLVGKSEKDNLSVIQASVSRSCRPCLDAFLAKRQELEPYLDIQKELNKSMLIAVQNDDVEMLDYLVELNADVNYSCECCYNRSPILMSLIHKRYNLFYKLLELGANPNAIDQNGFNALHLVLGGYNRFNGLQGPGLNKRRDTIIGIIDTLLNNGLSIQQSSLEGYTPLILAGGTGDAVVFEHLVSKGATINLDNKREVITTLNRILWSNPFVDARRNQTFYEKVITDFHIQLSKSLFDTRDLDSTYSILFIVDADNREIFDKMMKLNVDVNVKNALNVSALMLAVENRNAYMCEKLLDAGAIIDVKKSKYKEKFEWNEKLLKKFKAVYREQRKESSTSPSSKG